MSEESDQNSNSVRKALRGGVVYSVAGVLAAGDAVSAAARGIGRGLQQSPTPTPDTGGAAESRPKGGGRAVGGALRSGVVYGLAKVLVAGRGVQQGAASVFREAAEQARADSTRGSAMQAPTDVGEGATEVETRDD